MGKSMLPVGKSWELRTLQSQKKLLAAKIAKNPNNAKAKARLASIEKELLVWQARGFF